MKIPVIIVVCSLLLFGCNSAYHITESDVNRGDDRNIPYKYLEPKNKASENIALVLNDFPDTFQLEKSPLIKMLIKEKYNVVIPGRYGETKIDIANYNSKTERLRDIVELTNSLKTTGNEKLIVIGFGEGAYLAPALANKIHPNLTFIVNAGPYSLLDEYVLFLKQPKPDSLLLHTMYSNNGTRKTQVLLKRIEELKEDEFGIDKLGLASNHYWMSYYNSPAYNDLLSNRDNCYWLVSKDYLLIAAESRKYIEQVCDAQITTHYLPIKGRGNFNNKEEMKRLSSLINELISN